MVPRFGVAAMSRTIGKHSPWVCGVRANRMLSFLANFKLSLAYVPSRYPRPANAASQRLL